MKTATGLLLLAAGAILAFAVTTNTSVFNLHVAGYVIMLVALAGLFIPRRQYQNISKRFVTRRTRTWPRASLPPGSTAAPVRTVLPGDTVVETEEVVDPPYVVHNPGSAAADADLPAVPSIPVDPTVRRVMTPGRPTTETEVVEQLRDE